LPTPWVADAGEWHRLDAAGFVDVGGFADVLAVAPQEHFDRCAQGGFN